MPRTKRKVSKGVNIRKSKKVLTKVPVDTWNKIRADLMEKYEIKSMQEIFDYVVVSGVVYLDSNVIKYIEHNVGPHIERYKQAQLARFGKCESPQYVEYHVTNFQMYPSEYDMFCKFLIEKNYKQQWIYEILLDGFVKEVPEIMTLVKKGKNNNVRKRKKVVARLNKDEWISALSEHEAESILEQLTTELDNKVFDESIQAEVDKLIENSLKEKLEDEEIENEINKKIAAIKSSRATSAGKIANAINLDEL